MPRDFELYLSDMIISCEKITRYVAPLSEEQFFDNEIIYDAVLRNLLIIGEAAKNIPEEVRKMHPAIEWKKVCGLRDIIAHTYFGIDHFIIWDVIQTKIPQLLKQLKKS